MEEWMESYNRNFGISTIKKTYLPSTEQDTCDNARADSSYETSHNSRFYGSGLLIKSNQDFSEAPKPLTPKQVMKSMKNWMKSYNRNFQISEDKTKK